MSGKKVAVFGIYSTRAGVENATDSLVKVGFPTSDISVLLPESLGGPKEMGTEKATKAPEGAAAGVTTGGVIGGTLGLLAGVGLLAIPGLGPFIAAGPIMAMLAMNERPWLDERDHRAQASHIRLREKLLRERDRVFEKRHPHAGSAQSTLHSGRIMGQSLAQPFPSSLPSRPSI